MIVFEKGQAADGGNLDQNDVIALLSKESPNSIIRFASSNPEEALSQFLSKVDSISAAGGVVRDPKTDLYLIIERHGVWDFPKGKIDLGETPAIASIREVEEECGVNGLIITREIGSTYHGYLIQGKPFIKRTYWFEMDCIGNTVPKAQAEEGISQVLWANNKQIAEYLNCSYASIKELWNQAYPSKKTD